VKLSGADRLKIICDPFWTPSSSKGTQLSCTRTYDVLDLLVPEAGTWEFSLSMRPEGDGFLLKRSMITSGGCNVLPPQSTALKMEFRRSLGCFLIQANESIDSLDCGLGLDQDGRFVAVTSELEKSLEEKIQQKLATTPQLFASCVFAKTPAGTRQNKRRSDDAADGSAHKRVSGKTKPQYIRLDPIKFPTACRRPDTPQLDPEQEEDVEFLDPVSDSDTYHSVSTSSESSVSLGAFTPAASRWQREHRQQY
ncbi:hypothetical protein LY76DRAFT_526111, partial [Colletotrichum caudatum]